MDRFLCAGLVALLILQSWAVARFQRRSLWHLVRAVRDLSRAQAIGAVRGERRSRLPASVVAALPAAPTRARPLLVRRGAARKRRS
jgi:hypothetical protein